MSMFTGKKCQICQKIFDENNIVVVCPECGAPYHEICYKENNKCIFESEHATDYYWQHELGDDSKIINCSNCKKLNKIENDACIFCGKTLKNESRNKVLNVYNSNKNKLQKIFDEEIAIELVNEFIGTNFIYFKEKFGNKRSFNLPAFFMPVIYFFYRKMYGIGSMLFLIFFMLISILFNNCKLFYKIAIENEFGNTLKILYTNILSFVGPLLTIIVLMIISGLIANSLYKNHIYKSIIRYKQVSGEHYRKLLPIVGGVSILSAVIAGISFIFFTLAMWMIIFERLN